MVEGVIGPLPIQNPIGKFFVTRLLNVPDLLPAFRDMYASPRGREYARKIAFLTLPAKEFFSVQMRLFTAEISHHLSFPGPLSPENEEIIWTTVCRIHDAYNAGRLTDQGVVALHLTLNGAVKQSWQLRGIGGVKKTT